MGLGEVVERARSRMGKDSSKTTLMSVDSKFRRYVRRIIEFFGSCVEQICLHLLNIHVKQKLAIKYNSQEFTYIVKKSNTLDSLL
jgi:hypothetical protein